MISWPRLHYEKIKWTKNYINFNENKVNSPNFKFDEISHSIPLL